MSFRTVILAALTSVFLSACATQAAPSDATTAPMVDAPAGAVRGVREDGSNVFRAIPYAQAPVGELRWRAPQPLQRWTGVRAATERGVACMQPAMAQGPYNRGQVAMSEDCLTLDVTTPQHARNAPVMVWIHGGTLIWGSGHSPMYSGQAFAERGVVLVSINYRLGVLGYLAHPELSAESSDGVSGNYGLLDQVAALRWVRDNIAAFGGDPNNVTIFGESAGALSVEYLLASPAARGLFDRAIVQSGYLFTMPELKTARYEEFSAEAIGAWVAAQVSAPTLAQLRTLDARELVDRAAAAGYAPLGTIDGRILPRQLVDTFERGEQAPVPLMAGFTSGEIRGLRFLLPPAPESAASYAADIRSRYGDLAGEYLRLYPADDLPQRQLQASRDVVFGWAAERLVRNQQAIGQPSYLYYFDHDYPAAAAADLTAFHASEVPFVFGTINSTPSSWPVIPNTPEERRISDAMVDYWASFARTGAPVATDGPAWAPFSHDRSYLIFNHGPTLSTQFMPGMFALHEQAMCRRRQSGAQSWNWRSGSTAPVLPEITPQCAAAAH